MTSSQIALIPPSRPPFDRHSCPHAAISEYIFESIFQPPAWQQCSFQCPLAPTQPARSPAPAHPDQLPQSPGFTSREPAPRSQPEFSVPVDLDTCSGGECSQAPGQLCWDNSSPCGSRQSRRAPDTRGDPGTGGELSPATTAQPRLLGWAQPLPLRVPRAECRSPDSSGGSCRCPSALPGRSAAVPAACRAPSPRTAPGPYQSAMRLLG